MEQRIKHRIHTLVISYISICVIALAGILFLNHHALDCSKEYMTDAGLDMLEDRLIERVDNLVIRIENQRFQTYQDVEKLCTWITAYIQDDTDYATSLQEWGTMLEKTEHGNYIQMILSTPEQCVYYHNGSSRNLSKVDHQVLLDYVTSDSIYRTVAIGSTQICVFAKHKDLDDAVLDFARTRLYTSDFGSDGYAWINKILNYDGGDDFAVRLIYPAHRDQEGALLSTSEVDAKGNRLLQDELDGIKAQGKVMRRYYLTDPDSQEVQEKISYSVLYEPYDWVISSGEPLDKIDALVLDAWNNAKTAILYSTTIVVFILLLSGVFISFFVYNNTQKLQTSVNNYVFEETKLDSLTGVFTRSGGMPLLTQDWRDAIFKQLPLLLMVVDVDNFKSVNDTYGHDVGDLVLKEICSNVQNCIRQSDYIIRLGGEEFVVICKNVNLEHLDVVSNKILSAVRASTFNAKGKFFHVSVSIGAALPCVEDGDFAGTIKRADQALYKAKNTGKDRCIFAEQAPGSTP